MSVCMCVCYNGRLPEEALSEPIEMPLGGMHLDAGRKEQCVKLEPGQFPGHCEV